MKSFVMMLISLCSAYAVAGSGTASMDVTAQMPLVPGKAFSCLAQKNGAVTPDIESNHISVDKFTVTNDSNEALNVAFVKITVTGLSHPYVCQYGGDALLATGLPEVLEIDSVGVIDCPLYCGGIADQAPGSYPAAVEVYGFFEDKAGNQSPLKIKTLTEVLVR